MNARLLRAAILATLLSGCSSRPAPTPDVTVIPDTTAAPAPTPPPAPEPARVILDHRPVRLALLEPVNGTHAPVPRNVSERFVFRQLYETLVERDSAGSPRPALAAAWRRDDAGRVWTFEIRKDARFSDGAPVTAESVKESWGSTDWQPGSSGTLLPWGFVSPDSVSAAGNGDLRVALTVPIGDRPLFFAHPALAVVRPKAPGQWPAGTGSHAVSGSATRASFVAEPADTAMSSPILFRVSVGVDPRNIIPNDADGLIASDRAILEYASLLPGFAAAALKPLNTYYLVTPEAGTREAGAISDHLRGQLASDAVSTGAKEVAAGPEAGSCADVARPERSGSRKGAGPGAGRIAYSEGDPEAQRIAERLVALVRAAGRGELPADLAASAALLKRLGGGNGEDAAPVGMSDGRLGSLFGDNGSTLVVRVPADFQDPCLETAALMDRLDLPAGPSAPPLAGRVQTLISTSAVFLHRAGLAGWRSGWDGVPRLGGIGWIVDGKVP